MKFYVLTLFPQLFENFLKESIVSIAVDNSIIEVFLIDIRDFAFNKHRQADDYPYGGGAGMVMKPEPVFAAMNFLSLPDKSPVIYFTPQGNLLNQEIVNRYKDTDEIVIICGHYKEIDHRIRQYLVTEELSIGDYVLSGGEIPAMVFIDALTRLQEGVLNNLDSALNDSHQSELLGCPHYTRPAEFNGMKVPDVLISGNHKEIDEWRKTQSLRITSEIRPDLIKRNSTK